MEAIDKEKVIAEIKELYNDIDKCISELIAARGNRDGNGISNAHWRMETLMVNTLQAICNVIDTLETKEVDLEKEIKSWLDHGHITDTRYDDYDDDDIERTAKHFFELGLKTKVE